MHSTWGCFRPMAERAFKKRRGPRRKRRAKTTSIPEPDDIISKLPHTIIAHILSFLHTSDAVRTCILSKRWKFMWYSVPTLFFSDTSTTVPEFQKFHNYVDTCLEHRKRGMYFIADSAVTSFKLDIQCSRRSKARHLDKWLGFVVENKVKELSLNLNPGKAKDSRLYYYGLPETVVNAKDLTILELSGVELGFSFSFPSLKSLSLEDVRLAFNVKNDVLSKSLLDCPSLEKLLLSSCNGISTHSPLRLQSSSLKFMEIQSSVSLQVEAINLESLVLRLVCFEEINLSACKALRNLSLTRCIWGKKTDQLSFEDLISNFPLLENLTLDKNYYHQRLKRLNISSQHLKIFKLSNWSWDSDTIKVVTIKSTPKLTSFCYEGSINCSISVESPNLLNGKFIITDYTDNYDTNWFINMINFFMNFNCSWEIVTLHVFSDKALIMPDNCKKICRSPLLDWKHVRVTTTRTRSTVRKSELKDALVWISPSLKTLSINGEDMF